MTAGKTTSTDITLYPDAPTACDIDPVAVAGEWHSGQWSALYAFASTRGRACHPDDMRDEIRRSLRDARALPEMSGDPDYVTGVHRLEALQEWIEPLHRVWAAGFASGDAHGAQDGTDGSEMVAADFSPDVPAHLVDACRLDTESHPLADTAPAIYRAAWHEGYRLAREH